MNNKIKFIDHTKTRQFIFFTLAFIALIFLASGLSAVNIESGFQLHPDQVERILTLLNQLSSKRTFIISVFIFLFMFIFLKLLNPTRSTSRRRPKKIKIPLYFYFFLWILIILLFNRRLDLEHFKLNLPQQFPSVEMLNSGNTESFHFMLPAWLSFSLSFLLLLGFVLVFWRVWRRSSLGALNLGELAKQSDETIDQLRNDAAYKNVILRCYVEMSEILLKSKGIKRRRDMTAREFEAKLLITNIPPEAVRQLTVLFENARYGNLDVTQNLEAQAIACLNEIRKACER